MELIGDGRHYTTNGNGHKLKMNSLPAGYFFTFCRLPIPFKNKVFRNLISGLPPECQTDGSRSGPTLCLA